MPNAQDNFLSSRRFAAAARRLAVALAPALLLSACASLELPKLADLKLPSLHAGKQKEDGAGWLPAETLPVQDEAVADRLQLAVDLLQHGQAASAQTELKAHLAKNPESRAARSLLAQIETPVPLLFPPQSFEVKLGKDQTLSSLAEIYLGDALSFYGLARYNGIATPSKVAQGQTIHIPRTPKSLTALKTRSAQAQTRPAARATTAPQRTVQPARKPAAESATSAPAPRPAPEQNNVSARETPIVPAAPAVPVAAENNAPALPAPANNTAEAYYRSGLTAFQRQDLDGAIAAWNRTLALNPGHTGAQVNRTQALELKQNLERLRERSADSSVIATREAASPR
jgi:tetratricopeptide (TPR) repeat protein